MRAPRTLEKTGVQFWKEMTAAYELEGHHLALLEQACACLDRIAEARKQISEHGVLVTNRFDELRVNPACEVEQANKRLFRGHLRELGLDVESSRGEEYSRPPATIAPGSHRKVAF